MRFYVLFQVFIVKVNSPPAFAAIKRQVVYGIHIAAPFADYKIPMNGTIHG